MEERLRATIKDQFLAYALRRLEYFSPKDFLEEFPASNLYYDDLIDLIKEILSYNAGFFDLLNGNGLEIFLISAKPKAEEFLAKGGFQSIYEVEEKEWKLLIHNLFERKKARNQQQKVQGYLDEDVVKKDVYYYALVIMAIVGFLYAIFDAIVS